jgi:hypothetical protein
VPVDGGHHLAEVGCEHLLKFAPPFLPARLLGSFGRDDSVVVLVAF